MEERKFRENLLQLTCKDLRNWSKKLPIAGYARKKKHVLVEAILNHPEALQLREDIQNNLKNLAIKKTDSNERRNQRSSITAKLKEWAKNLGQRHFTARFCVPKHVGCDVHGEPIFEREFVQATCETISSSSKHIEARILTIEEIDSPKINETVIFNYIPSHSQTHLPGRSSLPGFYYNQSGHATSPYDNDPLYSKMCNLIED